MKVYKLKTLPTFQAFEKKCKFSSLCDLYSNASYTCTHVGGKYCGKYRVLSQTPKEKVPATDFILAM